MIFYSPLFGDKKCPGTFANHCNCNVVNLGFQIHEKSVKAKDFGCFFGNVIEYLSRDQRKL